MYLSFRALHSISVAFQVPSSVRAPGLHAQELRLRVLLLNFGIPDRIFKPEQASANPTQCLGHIASEL